jgi:hypothetical protein
MAVAGIFMVLCPIPAVLWWHPPQSPYWLVGGILLGAAIFIVRSRNDRGSRT